MYNTDTLFGIKDTDEKQIQIDKLDTGNIIMKEIGFPLAKRVIEENHYSHCTPSGQYNFGFYIDDEKLDSIELSTVMIYSQGANHYMSKFIAEDIKKTEVLELARLFSFDWAPKNIESYCIGQSFDFLNKNTEVRYLVSYADFNHNHAGTIYQATNWFYTGLGAKGKNQILLDGKPIHTKSIYSEVGTNKMEDVIEFYKQQGKKIEVQTGTKGKARYIYILGNKREKKNAIKKLKVKIYGEYPKNYNHALKLEKKYE